MAKKKSRKSAPRKARTTTRPTRQATKSTGPSATEMRATNTMFLKAFGILAVLIIGIALLYSMMPGIFSGFFGPQEVDFAYTDANENKYSFNTIVPMGSKVTDSTTDDAGNILPATIDNNAFKMTFESLSESFEDELAEVTKLDDVKNFTGVFRERIISEDTSDYVQVYGNKYYDEKEVCKGIGIALTEVSFDAPCGERALYLGSDFKDGAVYVTCEERTEGGLKMCDEIVRELKVEIVE